MILNQNKLILKQFFKIFILMDTILVAYKRLLLNTFFMKKKYLAIVSCKSG
jgi:hypothetical protein